MRYSTEPKFRKYVKGNSFLSIAKKCGDKYGKKLMDTAKKTNRNRCCKNFKKSSSENCRSYRRFDRNKIADKITSLGKTKSKEKKKNKMKDKKSRYHQKKCCKLLMT